MPVRATFPKSRRLRKRADFLRVQRRGRRCHTPHFVVVRQRSRHEDSPRAGFTVSKEVGNAVARNYVKRRLREFVRRNWTLLEPGFDYVVIARSGARELVTPEIEAELARGFSRG